MKNLEVQPIQLIDTNPNACDKVRKDTMSEARAILGATSGEPLSGLTKDETDSYRDLLLKLNVPQEDAERCLGRVNGTIVEDGDKEDGKNLDTEGHQFNRIKTSITNIRSVIPHFGDLVRSREKPSSQPISTEAIPVRQEVPVFKRG